MDCPVALVMTCLPGLMQVSYSESKALWVAMGPGVSLSTQHISAMLPRDLECIREQDTLNANGGSVVGSLQDCCLS